MIKVILKSTWNNVQGELERLRPIAEAMDKRGFTAEDFKEKKFHLRKSAGKKERRPDVTVEAIPYPQEEGEYPNQDREAVK